MLSNEFKMTIVRCPEALQGGPQKRKTADFCLKSIVLRLKKACYKVSLCESCQQQSCMTFTGLTIRAKMIGGWRSLVRKILDQTDRAGAKSPIFDLFALVVTQP